jgi:hypothetical protein
MRRTRSTGEGIHRAIKEKALDNIEKKAKDINRTRRKRHGAK